MTTATNNINLPNFLSLCRLLIVPLFIILLTRELYDWALAVFILAGLTDGLDGFLARVLDQRTTLGSYLDPVADKCLLISSYSGLAILFIIPAWVSIIVISRDILILIGVFLFLVVDIEYEIRPSRLSKVTAFFQQFTIGFALLSKVAPGAQVMVLPMCWLTAILTVASGIHYTWIGLTIIQGTPKKYW